MSARIIVGVLVVALVVVPACASPFSRSKISSRWTVTAAADGVDSEEQKASAFVADGLSVRAMNDAGKLYLQISASTRDSRDQLKGASHQDITLWFIGPDGKSRDWGARLAFSRRGPLTAAQSSAEYVRPQGTGVSTGTLPGDIRDRQSTLGDSPVWELSIPLNRLAVTTGMAVAIDFTLNAPPAGARRRTSPHAMDSKDGKKSDYGRREELVWEALSYALTVRLAPEPSPDR